MLLNWPFWETLGMIHTIWRVTVDDNWLALITQSSQGSSWRANLIAVENERERSVYALTLYPGKLASTASPKRLAITKGEQSHRQRLERSKETVKELTDVLTDGAAIGTAYEEASTNSLLVGPSSLALNPVVAIR